LIKIAVWERTSSRSKEALTSSPISERVASTSADTSDCSVVACVCGFEPVAFMNTFIIAGEFGSEE